MTSHPVKPLEALLDTALEARAELLDTQHNTAWRLFNGFYEGDPDIVIDVYGRTLVIFNHAEPPESSRLKIDTARGHLASRLPWIKCTILKDRKSDHDPSRFGQVIAGEAPDRRVEEHGIKYAIDLLINQDASFYLDTRNVRAWALKNLTGKSVLNTFAYTSSLGVAARGAGAQMVIHTDQNRKFLNIAKMSYSLNGFPIDKSQFIPGDFWSVTARMRREERRFDCVFIDPPVFATTRGGAFHLARDTARMLNKIRPLVHHHGWLLAINNALFVRGEDYMQTLESLCAEGYMQIEKLIPVPQDITGYPETRLGSPPVDPYPFNHPTKIALLRIKRKEA